MKKIKRFMCKMLYRYFATYLPDSDKRWFRVIRIGRLSRKIRYVLCRNVFEYCGKNVNIQRNAQWGSGATLRVGDNSGLGMNCVLPEGTIIGNNVMMGRDLTAMFTRGTIVLTEQIYQCVCKVIRKRNRLLLRMMFG